MDSSPEFSKRGVEILNISVDLGNGTSKPLSIYEHDNPSLTVRTFFIKNNITSTFEKALVVKVEELMQEVFYEHKLVNQALAIRPSIPLNYKNYGEKLYIKGLQRIEERLAKHQMQRITTAKEIEKTLTDRPKIDKNSKRIVSKSLSNSVSCININSPRLSVISEIGFSSKLFKTKKKLGENAENPKKKNFYLTKEKNLSEIKKKPSGFFKIESKLTKTKEFESNDAENPKESKNSKKEIKRHLSICVDPITGHKYFKVVKPADIIKNVSICEYNQNKSKFSPEDFSDSPFSPVKLEGKVKTEKILKNKKFSRFLKIFEQLSPNDKGEVVYSNINFSLIDPQLLKILSPLLEKLKDSNFPLKLPGFLNAIESLLKTLSPIKKNVLLAKNLNTQLIKQKEPHKKSESSATTCLSERNFMQKQKTQLNMNLLRSKQAKVSLKSFTPRTSKILF